MREKLSLFILLFQLIPLQSINAKEGNEAAGRALVQSETLTVYSQMENKRSALKSLKKGDTVFVEIEIEGFDGSWCGIAEKQGQAEVTGYVECKYLAREKTQRKNWHTIASPETPPSPPPASNPQTIKYFTGSELNIKYVTVDINGVPVQAALDTGASLVSFNSETIQKLGITEFKQQVRISSANGITDAYLFTMPSIKLGTVEATNVDCIYVPNTSINLLGGSFLSNFNYSINEKEKTITFTSK